MKAMKRTTRSTRSRLGTWGLFLAVLFTVGTGFNPGSLKRCGCSVDPEEAARLTDLAGRILGARDNAPISGATIDLNDRMTSSDALGDFLFRDVAPGTYNLMVTAPGYQPVTQSIEMPAASEQPLMVQLRQAGLLSMPLPVADAKVSGFDPITNYANEPHLCFEWGEVSISGLATYYSYLAFDLSVLPPGVTLESVTLHGTRLPSTRGAGGGDEGNVEGQAVRSRVGPRAAADEFDLIIDAYAVLEGWNEGEIKFLDRPRVFSTTPVASAELPTMSGETYAFVMDLTEFAQDLLSGRRVASGILFGSRDLRTLGGADLHYITSSEYQPAEQALRVVAEYRDAAGKTVQVTLR